LKFFDKNILRTADFIDTHLYDKKSWYSKYPPFSHLELSITGNCNRSCFFCPYGDPNYKKLNESISLEVLNSLLSSLKQISFSGFCEPLLHKNIDTVIKNCKEYCPKSKVEMVTNGDLLTLKKMKSLFDSGLDNLRISLYDTSNKFKFDFENQMAFFIENYVKKRNQNSENFEKIIDVHTLCEQIGKA